MNGPILTISMLVSGREETTEKSLQSIQQLREVLGAEVILTDTGCTSEYINRIRKFADKVLTFTWCNDFAKARNVGLEAANGQWLLYLDDDEWFEDVNPIIDFFQSGEYLNYEQAVYLARNYGNAQGTVYTDNWVSRMIHVEKDTHFEGRVHEALVPARGKCKKINAFVHHYGYVFATDEERKKHYERNVSILKSLIKEEPNNLQWKLQIIKEYLNVQDYKSLREASEDALFSISDINDSFVNLCRGSFYLGVLTSDAYEEKLEHMWEHYTQFAEDKRNPVNVSCALAGFVAKILLSAVVTGVVTESRQVGLAELKDSNKDSWMNRLLSCGKTYTETLKEWENTNRSEQEDIIAENAVFINDYVSRNVLLENVQNQIAGNGEFLSLPDAVWELGVQDVVPFEDMILELPISQWMVQMMVLTNQPYGSKWEQIGVRLGQICTRSDIRYCYFDAVTENTKMRTIYSPKKNVERMDYETMTQILTEFAQANLNYMDYLYTEVAFEGDMEILSKEEKAAMWIASGLSADDGQWRVKLQYFSEAAKVYPQLGEFVKRYIKLLGQELTK